MTREQYNQAGVYLWELNHCEKVIKTMGQSAVTNEVNITLSSGGDGYARVAIEDAALIEGLMEYIKAWYTNRKAELETLLEKI